MYKKIGDTVKYENKLYKVIDTHSKKIKSLGMRIGGGSSRTKVTLTIQAINNPEEIIEVESKKVIRTL